MIRTSYERRVDDLSHPLAKQVCQICHHKNTNLCLSADLTSLSAIIDLADRVGDKISVLKIHVDMVDDFDLKKIAQLQAVAKKRNFVVFEDRKFNDIGKTVRMQYSGGMYKISQWAQLCTVMTVSGPHILAALSEIGSGFLLIAEMSSAGNKFSLFTREVYEEAKSYPTVVGFIAQKSFGDGRFLTFTPGINSAKSGDALGQQYNTPETAIKAGADVIIIGTGICSAVDPVKAAEEYRLAGWQAHLAAVEKKVSYPLLFTSKV